MITKNTFKLIFKCLVLYIFLDLFSKKKAKNLKHLNFTLIFDIVSGKKAVEIIKKWKTTFCCKHLTNILLNFKQSYNLTYNFFLLNRNKQENSGLLIFLKRLLINFFKLVSSWWVMLFKLLVKQVLQLLQPSYITPFSLSCIMIKLAICFSFSFYSKHLFVL